MEPTKLLALAQDTTDAGRTRLTEAISEFFKDHHLNEKEQVLAGDILMSLIRQAEVDLRAALAERLATHKDIPAGVIVFLANDEFSVAEKILMHSPVLNDVDLVHIIRDKGQEYWRAIAQRNGISPVVANTLIDTSDTGTVLTLVNNLNTRLQKESMKRIARMAMLSETLQAPLLRREEVDAELAVDLYMVVSQALREEIVKRFHINTHLVEKSIEMLLQELTNEARGETQVTPEMMVMAKRFAERKSLSPDLMIRTLRRGQLGFFIALFAQAVGFEPATVNRLICKNEGRSFIVACRHIGMMKSEFASIFLLSRGIRDGEKAVDQGELAMAINHYDALKDFDVGRIVKSWVRDQTLV